MPLMARAARLESEGHTIFQLGQAQVDYEPPSNFIQALVEACQSREHYYHGYAPDAGTAELRAALSRYLALSFGFEADPENEILVTPGANHAAYTALTVLLAPGDEAILISPYYFNHLMTVTLLGAQPHVVETPSKGGFIPRIEDIVDAWSPRTRVLILVNPSNPTGARYPDDWIRELAAALARDPRWEDVWILSDQTYQEIYFSGDHPVSPASILRIRERSITVSSFSKSFALAGWRLGFLTAPEPFVDQCLKIQDSSVICATYAAQHALARTLQQEKDTSNYLAEKRALLARRRDSLLRPLREDGEIEVQTPAGACFAFLALPDGTDAETFAWELLSAQRVVTVPGDHFGRGWNSHLRLSFGRGTEVELEEAGRRIVSYRKTL
jgi:aspartate/methionine/tyrosine aminotransferase